MGFPARSAHMRVTEITHEDSSWSPLVLHPRLTVVWGEPAQLAELTAVFENLYSGAGSTVGGSVEYAGFTMPLDQTTVVSLDVHGSGLRAIDTSLLERARSRIRADLASSVDARLAELDGRSKLLVQDTESLRRRSAAAAAATAAVSDELDQGSSLVADLAQRHEVARRAPEELEAAIDAALEEERLRECALAVAEELSSSVLEALDPTGSSIVALRLGSDCSASAATLAEACSAGLLSNGHAASVDQWFAQVEAGTAEVSQQVVGMLDEIRLLEHEWEELSTRGVEGDPAVTEARERLEEVAVRTSNLEELAGSGLLAERARSEIDAAHEAADAAEEHRVLELYGFDSYLDYTIALSTRSVGDAIEATVDRARAESVRATDALEMAREQAASALGELNDRRGGLRRRISDATGVEPESLSAEVLATIPQLPQELLDAPAAVRASLDSLRVGLEMSREVLAERRAEREGLVDPEVIRTELDVAQARLADLEALLVQAEQVHGQALELLEEKEAELETLRAEREELMTDGSVLNTSGAESTATEVAIVIRAVTEQVVCGDAEPTPVLLTDSFSSFGRSATEVLDAVVANSPGVQFVCLTQDESVAFWAKRLDADAGALVRLGRRRWLGRRLARSQGRQAEGSTLPR